MENQPVKKPSMFRTLGPASARQDLRGFPGDLDGVGSPPDMYSQGPEALPTPVQRLMENLPMDPNAVETVVVYTRRKGG